MNSNTLVFKITKKNDFLKLDFNTDVKNFIADLTDINKEVYELLIEDRKSVV
jgi:hypothetical protein